MTVQSALASIGFAKKPCAEITGNGDVPTTVQAMKAGAVEFLTKPFADDVLLAAIRGAIEHSRMVLREESDLRALKRGTHRSACASERSWRWSSRGLLNKEAGSQLAISEITVKAHRGQVVRKMMANSLAELVTMAARLGARGTPRP
jgi:FixJ family two-component response regulator